MFGRYRYKRFRAEPAEDMLQVKIGDIFKELSNVFGTPDDTLLHGMIKMAQTMIQHSREYSFMPSTSAISVWLLWT